MIKTFGDKETKRIFNEQFSKKFPQTIQKVALRKLIMINNANSLEDLRIPPNNRLEALKGDRKGQHSIRINDQFRICFIFSKFSLSLQHKHNTNYSLCYFTRPYT